MSDDSIFKWRFETLRGLGFSDGDAWVLADNRGVDLHRVARMVRAGCSVELAVRILR